MTSAAEITAAAKDTEKSDADASKLVLHLNREDVAKELTGTQLTFTAKPNADKLTAEADRTRTLTFGDRTYTLSFASRFRMRRALATNTSHCGEDNEFGWDDQIKIHHWVTDQLAEWKLLDRSLVRDADPTECAVPDYS